MNDDRQAGSAKIGGGGEWTALREALLALRDNERRLADGFKQNRNWPRENFSLCYVDAYNRVLELVEPQVTINDTAQPEDGDGSHGKVVPIPGSQTEALAAAAPAPPAKVYALLDYEADGDALISVHATEESANKAKELVAPIRCWIQECDVVAPPPQDGQGTELLGPPRGGDQLRPSGLKESGCG